MACKLLYFYVCIYFSAENGFFSHTRHPNHSFLSLSLHAFQLPQTSFSPRTYSLLPPPSPFPLQKRTGFQEMTAILKRRGAIDIWTTLSTIFFILQRIKSVRRKFSAPPPPVRSYFILTVYYSLC